MDNKFYLMKFILFFCLSWNAFASQNLIEPPFSAADLNLIKSYLFANIATSQQVFTKKEGSYLLHSLPGAVIASPSNKGVGFSQDYQFHWVRDAAITMQEVVSLYAFATPEEKIKLKPYLMNYIRFEARAQKQISNANEETLGQPKFNIDGTVWEGEWGRPQNDGPALRAITMLEIARLIRAKENTKNSLLTDIIRLDLDFVRTHWQEKSYDLWEEVYDQDHFFNKMVQRKALVEGAAFFAKQGDVNRAKLYSEAADQLTRSLLLHWNEGEQYYTETIKQSFFKGGGLDSAIILGVLYGKLNLASDPFALNNEKVLSSIYFIRNAFAHLYKINLNHAAQSPLLGRYPNDIYDGNAFSYGNPWILTSAALAHYYYALAKLFLQQGEINITPNTVLFFQQLAPQFNKIGTIVYKKQPQLFESIIKQLQAEGDSMLRTIKSFSRCDSHHHCLHFAEQVDRLTGESISAKDLTWGYTTILEAMQTRAELMLLLKNSQQLSKGND